MDLFPTVIRVVSHDAGAKTVQVSIPVWSADENITLKYGDFPGDIISQIEGGETEFYADVNVDAGSAAEVQCKNIRTDF